MKKFLIIILCLFFVGCKNNPSDKNDDKNDENDIIDNKVETVPIIKINTDEAITSKYNYVNGKFNLEDDIIEEYNLSDIDLKIRRRGNSSNGMPKKSYRLKFNKKIDLFGFGEAKNWVLIANYMDRSLMRNYYAYTMSSMMENLEFTPRLKYVEVYINDEYMGLYTLCDQIQAHEIRVDIKADLESLGDEIPFFVEFDYYTFQYKHSLADPYYYYDHFPDEDLDNLPDAPLENVDYFVIGNKENYNSNVGKTDYGYPFSMKYPETLTEVTENQANYIKNYINETNSAILNNKDIDKYIDIKSFAEYFAIQELFKNPDIGVSSIYYYKRNGELLKAGPIWDFDLSVGNAKYIQYGYNGFLADSNRVNDWYVHLRLNKEFKKEFVNCLNNIKDNLLPKLIKEAEKQKEVIKEAYYRNFSKWQLLGIYDGTRDWAAPEELIKLTTIDEHVDYINNYLTKRCKSLLKSLEFGYKQ